MPRLEVGEEGAQALRHFLLLRLQRAEHLRAQAEAGTTLEGVDVDGLLLAEDLHVLHRIDVRIQLPEGGIESAPDSVKPVIRLTLLVRAERVVGQDHEDVRLGVPRGHRSGDRGSAGSLL